MDNKNNYLVHYASKYYDPVKAHQYYEEHKQLKGRTSTSGLTEEGRIAARYVKSRIDSETKTSSDALSEQRKAEIEARKNARDRDIETHKVEMHKKIDNLKSILKNMSKEERAKNRERINTLIGGLRDENRAKREEVQSQYKTDVGAIRDKYRDLQKQNREKGSQKYEYELSKLKSEDAYKTKPKSSKSDPEAVKKFIEKNKQELKKQSGGK